MNCVAKPRRTLFFFFSLWSIKKSVQKSPALQRALCDRHWAISSVPGSCAPFISLLLPVLQQGLADPSLLGEYHNIPNTPSSGGEVTRRTKGNKITLDPSAWTRAGSESSYGNLCGPAMSPCPNPSTPGILPPPTALV